MRKILFVLAALFVFAAVESNAQVITPGRKIIVRGSGGYHDCPGNVKYCPNPSDQTCVIIEENPIGTPTKVTVFGRGGVIQGPCGPIYCPDPSPDTCTTIVPADNAGGNAAGLLMGDRTLEITVFNPNETVTLIRRADGSVVATPGEGADSDGQLD